MSGTLSLTFNVASAPTNVTLPITENPSDPITFTINWGDGNTDSSLSHTYATNASFTAVVTITAGSVTQFGNGVAWTGVDRLTALATSNNATWGLPGVTSLAYAFRSATLLTSVPTGIPSSVTNLSNMFNGADIFNQDITSWNVSNVTNMFYMFNSTIFNNGSITNDGLHPLNWNVSNVTNMGGMFRFNNANFNQDISSWNVSSVTDMTEMFHGATAFNNGATTNVGGKPLTWTAGTGTSNVTTMSQMFSSANVFNQDISSWNVSSVTNMSTMFSNAGQFNNGSPTNDSAHPLTWSAGTGTSNVTLMNSMFDTAYSFNQDISGWNVINVTKMNDMFRSASVFNKNISSWNFGNVDDMSNMFAYGAGYNQDISGWDVSSVTFMNSMFISNTAFNNGSLTNDGLNPLTWGNKTSLVTNMSYMFNDATAFNQDVSSWNVSNVTNMAYMFKGATLFNNGSITNDGLHQLTWSAGTGTSNVTDMQYMLGFTRFNQYISGWNVSSVTFMNGMFQNSLFNNGSPTNDGLHSLTWSTGTGTSNVTNMEVMFAGSQFNQDISSWDVSKVTIMRLMFQGNSVFNNGSVTNDQLHPLTWGNKTSLVTNMSGMLRECNAFNQNISSWNVSKVTDMSEMFNNSLLFNQDISSWSVSKVTDMSQMFRNTAVFNKNIRSWKLQSSITLTNMFNGATAFQAAFYPTTPGYNAATGGNATPLYTFFTPISLTLTFNNTPGSVTLPISGTSVAVSVNWGDSTIDTSLSHTYAGAGPYNAVVVITSGTVTSFGSASWTGVNKLTAVATSYVSTWGLGESVTSFANAFNGATSLTSVPSNIPSSVTNLSSMFQGATLFNQDISLWNVNSVTNMTSMFQGATAFNKNIRYWIVSAGTTLTDMFNGATAFQAAFYPTTPGYNAATGGNATPLYNFFEPASLTLRFSNTPGSVTLPISGTSVVVSVDWGDSTINTSLSHTYAGAGPYNAVVVITSGTVTTFGSDNWTGVNNLIAVATNNTSTWGLGVSVTSFAYCFKGAVLLISVPSSIPSSVTNVQSMFQDATRFNQSISGWDVTNITNMTSMFQGASAFNKQIRKWKVAESTTLTNMFSGATAFQAIYYPTTPGYNEFTGGNATPLYNFFNLGPYPCFLEGTQILCFKNNREVYRPVESLRKGDLVKTIYNGYLPVHMIGTSPMYNPDNNDRIASRLYRCTKENYPGLFEDLYITGCHSILVPSLTSEQGEKTIASLGRLFVTDKHCRLMAWVDEKSEPCKMAGVYNIYHIALENNDYYMNYGIYANGLLVESCSKRYLTEISNMRILGEEDTSLTEGVSAEEKVFHKMPSLIETC